MHDADLALALAAEAPVIALDTETTGLSIDAQVCGWVVADADVSVYVPVRHTGGGNINDPERFERELDRALAGRSRRGLLTVGHNLGFDLFAASKHNVIIWGPLEDTQINEVLLYEHHRDYTLGGTAKRYGLPGKDDQELYEELARRFGGRPTRERMEHFHKLDGSRALAQSYATSDGRTTFDVWRAQQGPLAEVDQWGFGLKKVHQLECELIPYLAAMRRKGIRVDLDYAERAIREIDEEIERIKVSFPLGFSPKSAKDVHAWMGEQGHPSPYQTGKGAPSYSEATLERSEPGRRIIDYRKLLTVRNTFLMPVLETHHRGDRIFPELKQMHDGEYGVKFGRFSCVNPNMQAYPKRNKLVAKKVRPVIVPDEGMQIYEADYSQQEPRLYTHYSECKALLEGYLSDPPLDVHTVAANLMEIDRQSAKTLGLSIFNGMTPPTLAARLKVSLSKAEELSDKFFASFPEIKEFKRETKETGQDRGYVRTILGRKQHFPGGDMVHAAVSRVIQGSAADHMKVRLLDLMKWQHACGADRFHVLTSIHDAVIWQSEGALGTAGGEVQAILENVGEPLNLILPMPVEIHWGRHWGEASFPGEYDAGE